jgi:hypothetical protein
MIDQRDRAESSDPADANEPTDNTDAKEPTEPIESAEPTEPMDSTEPREAMQSREPWDRHDHRDEEGGWASSAIPHSDRPPDPTGLRPGRSGMWRDPRRAQGPDRRY